MRALRPDRSKAVSAVEGAESAFVDLVSGGRSRVIVDGMAESFAVCEAVTSAGYTFSSNWHQGPWQKTG